MSPKPANLKYNMPPNKKTAKKVVKKAAAKVAKKAAAKVASKIGSPSSKEGRSIQYLDLAELQFDLRNPRYGAAAGSINTEIEALDHIVRQFGVEDVLSSISVNGFFDSEPLVGHRPKPGDKVKIVEGNRRLAASLVLSADERAKNQVGLRQRYHARFPTSSPQNKLKVPVIVYDGEKGAKDVLPYIGVRHIVGFLEWDSYAKVDWVDRVLRENDMELSSIVEMLGDKNGTIKRMLAGYRFINQAIKTSQFRPEQSQRKGRGSNPDYPFSWVYTALDHKPIKDFIGFREGHDGSPQIDPIPDNKLPNAGWLLRFLFGDKINGQAAAIDDSREIGDLAQIIQKPALCARLKDGAKVRVVVEEARPSLERLMDGFYSIEKSLRELGGLVIPGELSTEDAQQLIDPSAAVLNVARKVVKDIQNISFGDES
ncbi:MAG: hypothetical protein EOP06_04620 [Proteobacteria bacterium]|nr:MAG: hypothetical protein EOP06_04620 [Pseudomonadota bacterium]